LIGNRLKINRNTFERTLQIVLQSNRVDLANKQSEEMQDDDPDKKHFKYQKPFIPERISSQIEKDLDRTFPQNIRTIKESINMYTEIKVLLQLFYVYRPDIGYVQGMNYLATTLMSIFPLYEAFVCLCNMILANSKDSNLLFNMYTFKV
jgi:hypothetical protein